MPPVGTTGSTTLAGSMVTVVPNSAGLPFNVSLPSTIFGDIPPTVPSTITISGLASISLGTVTSIVVALQIVSFGDTAQIS